MTTPAVVDWEYLLGLRAMPSPGQPDVLGKLVALFLEVSTERVTAARAAVAAGDARALELAAHSLVGTAGLLRAAALRQAAHEVEQHAASGDLAAVGPLLEAMAGAVADVQAEFRAFTATGVPPGKA